MDSVKGQNKVSILIGPYFDEESVVSCLCGLQKRGVPVTVVGLTPTLLTGLHGLAVRPDFSLTEFSQILSNESSAHSIIFPGGHEGTAVLFSDPRIHKIINAILQAGNLIAAMLPAQQMLARIGVPSPQATCQYLAQNDLEIDEFIEQVADRLLLSCMA